MRIYPFFVPHGGCPHRCLFCNQHSTSGRQEPPPPEVISHSLRKMLPASGDGEVAFYGGSFTLLSVGEQSDYLNCAAPFIRAGRVGGIRISTRPDALSAETVERLRHFGVTTVEIGCQSFSPEILRRSARGHGSEDAAGAVARLKKAGLAVGLQLMPGLPGGDRFEAVHSLQKGIDLRPDFFRIYPAVVLRGTPLETLWRSGGFSPLTLEEGVDLCAELLWRCHREHIRVIRLGLQATPLLDSGEGVAAGPYHPSFGQLVRSRLWRRALERVSLSGVRQIAVHPSDVSDALGHRKENLSYLQRKDIHLHLSAVSAVPRGKLVYGCAGAVMLDLASY